MINTNLLTECRKDNFEIKVYGTKDEPWFVAVDIFRLLSLSLKNMSRTLENLDNDEKMIVDLSKIENASPFKLKGEKTKNVQGSHNTVWMISEPGFYKIALRARTEEAKKFQRWVTHDVLPRIRKYGYYKLNNDERKFVAYKEIAESLNTNVNDLDGSYGKMPRYRLEAEARRLKYEAKQEEEKENVIKDYPYSYDEMDALCYDDLEFIKGFIDPQNKDKYYKKLSNGEEWYSEKFKREIPKFLKKGFGV